MENCTLPAALGDITQPECEFNFEQIVRLLFQRRQPSATPSFATDTAFKALATWTPLLAATDDTKIVASPLFAGMTFPPSEGLFEGGNDNTTISGVEIYKGEGQVKVTGTFTGLSPAIAEELRSFSRESQASLGVSNLTVYMPNRLGEVVHDNAYHGVPIYNFRLSSVGSEGYGAKNKHTFSFSLPGDWDKNIGMTKPTFNPLTDL